MCCLGVSERVKAVVGYLFPKDLSHNFSHPDEEVVIGYMLLWVFSHSFSHSKAWLNHKHSVSASVAFLNWV